MKQAARQKDPSSLQQKTYHIVDHPSLNPYFLAYLIDKIDHQKSIE